MTSLGRVTDDEEEEIQKKQLTKLYITGKVRKSHVEGEKHWETKSEISIVSEGIMHMMFSPELHEKIETKIKEAKKMNKRNTTVDEEELERFRDEFAVKLRGEM